MLHFAGCRILAPAMLALALAGAASAGPDWVEGHGGTGDAGSLPGDAQVPFPTTSDDSLDRILGQLGAGSMALGLPDFEDMYLIFIDDPMAFSASTSGMLGGAADFPVQLWLFDASGFGIVGASSMSTSTTLTGMATDLSGSVIPGPGMYLLAISGVGSDPVDGIGDEIFSFLTPSEISGPDGSGGANAIAGWTPGSVMGEYIISLTGVSFVPGPGAIGLLLGAAALGCRRRRAR